MRGNRRYAALLGSLVTVVLCAGILGAAAVDGTPPAPEGGARAAAEAAAARAAAEAAEALAADPTTATAAPTGTSTPSTSSPTTTLRSTATTTTTATTRPSLRNPATKPPSSTTSVVASVPIRNDYGRVGAGNVVIPFSAGRTSWTAVSNGISITVRTDKPSPRAGEEILFELEMNSTTDACCNARILFGDQSEFSPTGPCFPPDAAFPVKTRTSHIYHSEGRWTFWAQAVSGDCRSPHIDAGLMGTIEVAPAPSSGQGPSQPTVSLHQSMLPPAYPRDPSWVSVSGQARDVDGWIRSVTLDWGDGTPPQEFGGDGMPCRPDERGWPSESRKGIFTDDAIHHYTKSGLIMITMTTVSTGCDGSARQEASGSLALWVPASG